MEIENFFPKYPNIFKFNDQNKPISYASLINYLNIEGLDSILSEIANTQVASDDKKKNLQDCIRWIKKNNIKRSLDEIRNQIKEAQDVGKHNRIVDLVMKYNKLMKECARC